MPVFLIASPRGQTIITCRATQFSPFLQAYFIIAERMTPTKAGRASPDTSQVPSTQDTVPEEFLRFYKKPLQVGVDVTTLWDQQVEEVRSDPEVSTEGSGEG